MKPCTRKITIVLIHNHSKFTITSDFWTVSCYRYQLK